MSVAEWPLVSDEVVLKTPVFVVHTNICRSPKDGRDKPFTVLEVRDWVQALALTEDGRAVLVRQYRLGSREFSLELPGGGVEEGQSPLEAARRELREETGYTAEKWRRLASFRPNPAIQNNLAHLYLAEGARLTHSTEFDENEEVEVELTPLSDLKARVLDGTVDHAIMAAGILYYFAAAEDNGKNKA